MAELVWVKVEGQEQYKALARRLKQAGRGDLQRKMTKSIRREGQPALRAVKAAWLRVDVSSSAGGGTASTGLRRRVSAATRISILGSGIRIRVEPKQVDPAYGKSLTFGLDGLGRWRHPVYGRDIWVQQYGEEVFFKTLEPFEARFRAGIQDAMAETAREIEG